MTFSKSNSKFNKLMYDNYKAYRANRLLLRCGLAQMKSQYLKISTLLITHYKSNNELKLK